MSNKILIAGLGSVGGFALEFLARIPNLAEIIVGSRDAEWGVEKTNIAKIGAGLMGYYPKISYRKMDLTDVDSTAEIIAEIDPTVILYAARYVKGIKYGAISRPLGLGYGTWICLSLPLIHKLMMAHKKSGVQAHVVNTAYPDGTNPVLARMGLAPTTGAGNLYHLIPRIKMGVGKELGVPAQAVNAYVVGSHFLDVSVSTTGSSAGSPYFLRVLVYGEDVTDRIGAENILGMCNIPAPHGRERNHMCASSAVRTIVGILRNTEEIIHAPGPNGLIGGYPVRLGDNGVDVVTPAGLSLEDAITINEGSLRRDGIDKILDDGTVVLTDTVRTIMKERFGVKHEEIRPDEWEDRGRILIEKVLS
jgi:hypothetical protein